MSYYILKQDTEIEGTAIVNSWPDFIDPLAWISGKPITTKKLDEKLVLDLSKESGDYRGDVIKGAVTLFSDELKEALSDFGCSQIEYYPVRLRDSISGDTEGGYWLINILELYQCIDEQQSKIKPWVTGIGVDYLSIIIDEQQTNGSKIFRLKEDPTLIVIHEELKDYLEKEDCLYGIELIATEEYSDW